MKKIKKIKMLFVTITTSLLIVFVAALINIAQNVKAYSLSSNGGNIKINISDYDGNEWKVGAIYDATISAQFDSAADNKQLKITLPAGLNYVNYPSKTVSLPTVESPASGTLNTILIDNTHAGLGVSYDNLYANDITYTFADNAGKVEVPIKIQVNPNLYYGPKVFSASNNEAIKAELLQNDASTPAETVNMDIKAGGSFEVKFAKNPASDNNTNTLTNLYQTTDWLTSPDTYVDGSNASTTSSAPLTYKKAEFKIYYQANSGMEVASINNLKELPAGVEITNDQNAGYAIISIDHTKTAVVLNTIQFDTSAASLGEHEPLSDGKRAADELTITTYDNQVLPVVTAQSYKLNIAADDNTLEFAVGGQTGTRADLIYQAFTDNYYYPLLYVLTNDNITAKEASYLEIKCNTGVQCIEMTFPGSDGNKILSLQYKTTMKSVWTTVSGEDLTKISQPQVNKNLPTLNTANMNLRDGEYFTEVVATLDVIPKGYSSQTPSTDLQYIYAQEKNVGDSASYAATPHILAKLTSNTNTGTVEMKTYSLNNNGHEVSTSAVKRSFALQRGTVTLDPTYNGTMPNKFVNAGDKTTISFDLGRADLTGGTIPHPVLYIKMPPNTSIDPETIVLKDIKKGVAYNDFNYSTKTVKGEQYAVIKLNHAKNGYMGLEYNVLNISFQLKTSVLAKGSYPWNSLIFLTDESSDVVITNSPSSKNTVADINDLDGDGNTTEHMAIYASIENDNKLMIMPQSELLVTTNLTTIVDGNIQAQSTNYEVSKPEKALSFTQDTESEYVLNILNNRNDGAGTETKLTMWLPVPKEGQNFGTNFQSAPFTWDMRLKPDAIPVVEVYDIAADGTQRRNTTKDSHYVIEYTSEATAQNYDTDAIWHEVSSADTNMIRISNDDVATNEKAIIKFSYDVAENAATIVQKPSKLGGINDFMPYIFLETETADYFNGARVGAKLVIGEISGKLFHDENKNNIYDANDTSLANINLDLYIKDSNDQYVPYIPAEATEQLSVQTAADGSYKFNNLPNGIYKIDFSAAIKNGSVFSLKDNGADDKIDSDVYHVGPKVGTLDEIDPTDEGSKYIFAGLLDYNPTQDLKLGVTNVIKPPASEAVNIANLNTTVKILAPLDGTGTPLTKTIKLYIKPDFFSDIAAKNFGVEGINLENNNEMVASVATSGTLSKTDDYLTMPLTITGLTAGTSIVSVTIQDAYGESRTVLINAEVVGNGKPTAIIEGGADEDDGNDNGGTEGNGADELVGHKTIKVGTKLDLATVIKVSDPEDGILIPKMIDDGGFDCTKVGTYLITYEAGDSDGNVVTLKVAVKVKPLIISGVVFDDTSNYNSQNDDDAYIGATKIALIDLDTKEVLKDTTSDATGKYALEITGHEKTTKVDNYALVVTIPAGYILANDKSVQPSSDSVIDLKTQTSPEYKAAGLDYSDQNIGMAQDITATITPNKHKMVLGANVSSVIELQHGSLVKTTLSDDHISMSQTSQDETKTTLNLKALSVGTSTITLEFSNGYQRSAQNMRKDISVEVAPITLSGVVFDDSTNFNSRNDDHVSVGNVAIALIDKDTKEVLKRTTSDITGKYAFEITGAEKKTLVNEYALAVTIPEGYILANDKSVQADSASVITLKTNTSQGYVVNGSDYLNQDIGMAKDVKVTLSPTAHKLAVGADATSTIELQHGQLVSAAVNNDHIKIADLNDTSAPQAVKIKALSVGESTITLKFNDGYNRRSEPLPKTITTEVTPITLSGVVFDDTSNYNSKNDDGAYLSGIEIALIDQDTAETLAVTTSDENGKYSFTINGNETAAQSHVNNYALRVTSPKDYILANDHKRQADSESIIMLDDNISKTFMLEGNNYHNQNIGMAKDVSVHITPTSHSIAVGDKAVSDIELQHGTLFKAAIDNKNISTEKLTDTFKPTKLHINGLSTGTSLVTLEFVNAYQRTAERIVKTIAVEVTPKITKQDKIIKQDKVITGDNKNNEPILITKTGHNNFVIAIIVGSLGLGLTLATRKKFTK